MKNVVFRSLLVICIILFFSGCSGSNTVSEKKTTEAVLDDYFENGIVFPSGNDEVTEYNKNILSISAFTLKIALPAYWSVSEKDDDVYELMGCFSINYIYNDNNERVGKVGYNVMPSDLDKESFIPIAIYNQIALGNDYRFDVKEKYDVLKSSSESETALTNVFYSAVVTDDNSEKNNKGIVMYDLTQNVYVAIEFENDVLSDEQYSYIANSLYFVREQ